MADLTGMGFNPAEAEDMGEGFTLVPPGIYTVIIAKSELKDTKTRNGKFLELSCQIVEGPHTGTVIFDRLNVRNPSEIAQKIGLSDLKHICDAIKFAGQLTDSAQLHGKPYSVKVDVENFQSDKDGTTKQSNKISKRMVRQKPTAASAPPTQPGAKQPQQAAAAAW